MGDVMRNRGDDMLEDFEDILLSRISNDTLALTIEEVMILEIYSRDVNTLQF